MAENMAGQVPSCRLELAEAEDHHLVGGDDLDHQVLACTTDSLHSLRYLGKCPSGISCLCR